MADGGARLGGFWKSSAAKARSIAAMHATGARDRRWRGRLPIPPKADPLVRQLIELMNEHMATLTEVAARARLRRGTISAWRYSRSPNIRDFQAAAQALGYAVILRPLDEQESTDG